MESKKLTIGPEAIAFLHTPGGVEMLEAIATLAQVAKENTLNCVANSDLETIRYRHGMNVGVLQVLDMLTSQSKSGNRR